MLDRLGSGISHSIPASEKQPTKSFDQPNIKSGFYNNFQKYIQLLQESGEISDEEYAKVQLALSSGEFKRFCQVCAATEAANMGIMKPIMYLAMPTIFAITDGDPTLTMLPYVIDRTAKVVYGYPIAKMGDFNHPFIFSLFNAFPVLGKYLTPAFCIAKDHKEISKYTAGYIKEKILFTLSLPNSQRIMVLLG